MSPEVVLIVPCKCEGENASKTFGVILDIMDRPLECRPDKVILVFDGDVDIRLPGTLPPDVLVTRSVGNTYGKTGACLAALPVLWEQALIHSATALGFWDCDMEYDLSDLSSMILACRMNPGASVVGARSGGKRLWRSIFANALVRQALRWRTGRVPPKDILTGSRICPLGVSVQALLQSSRFEMETWMTRLCLEQGVPIIEVPVAYRPRLRGKKIKPWDLFFLFYAAIRKYGAECDRHEQRHTLAHQGSAH
ncbi:hypothetical protein BAE30_03190 [Acidithiobacillus caldus]|uniref:Glycosyltransferase 2-like domain-containing protein n=1 Tax=Acidithiobacillus caldus TaxID=33059 RepID=A0A1E7YZU1_9PROT|nr:hypothetical protein BAE30_03190 [Acidithiobacillus caldus]